MFKRKQKPTTPPNFIDLRNPPKKPAKHGQSRSFNDIYPQYAPKKLLQLPRNIQYIILAAVGIVVIGGLIFAIMSLNLPAKNPVPQIIRDNSKLTIYYPDQLQLPNGYTLDQKSFSAGSQAIVYSVIYGKGQKINFTLQTKPSEQALQAFYASRIPLHTTQQTSIGTATIGAIGNQAIVSLPTNSNTWILVTAPSNIDQNALKQILHSLTK